MALYLDTNTITAKPQNEGGTGFNEWSTIKYNPDAYGLNKLLPIGIDASTSWTYDELTTEIGLLAELTADIDVDGIYTNVLFDLVGAGQLSQYQRINLIRACESIQYKGLYISWINSNGGIEYELFADKIEQEIDSDNLVFAENYVSNLQTANKKQFTFAGQSFKSYKVIKTGIQRWIYKSGEQINNVERYNDLKANSLTDNIFVYTRKYFGRIDVTDYNSTKVNAVKCSCANHGQNTGDEIRILAGDYAGTHTIFKIDNNSFYINFPFDSNESTVFNRIVKKQDWQLAIVSGFNVVESAVNNNISIMFDIKMPSFGVK